MQIRILHIDDWPLLRPLVQQLNPTQTTAELDKRHAIMRDHSYQAVGVFNKDTLVAASGFYISCHFYGGKELEITNFVVDANNRNKGYGKHLTNWLIDYAKQHHCTNMAAKTYLGNQTAHNFFERYGFTKMGYCHVNVLDDATRQALENSAKHQQS